MSAYSPAIAQPRGAGVSPAGIENGAVFTGAAGGFCATTGGFTGHGSAAVPGGSVRNVAGGATEPAAGGWLLCNNRRFTGSPLDSATVSTGGGGFGYGLRRRCDGRRRQSGRYLTSGIRKMNEGLLHIHPAKRILEEDKAPVGLLKNPQGLSAVFRLFDKKDQEDEIENEEEGDQPDPHLDIKIA